MAKNNQAGFTLIEIMLVMAISAMLAVLAFAGQQGLRSQAQFDADVNKLVSTLADAHNEATAAVNVAGRGDGSHDCLNNPVGGNTYEFAGVQWSGINAPAGGVYAMTFYAADRTATPQVACAFSVTPISVPSNIHINPAPASGLAKSLFVRDEIGGLRVCAVTSAATNVLASFAAGTCTAGAVGSTALILNLSDADGHTSVVQVDPSGLAKRIN
jgi:prepilin-type N-terminal cleavage/methylation domain-containing protein